MQRSNSRWEPQRYLTRYKSRYWLGCQFIPISTIKEVDEKIMFPTAIHNDVRLKKMSLKWDERSPENECFVVVIIHVLKLNVPFFSIPNSSHFHS